jgi:RNA methyltransferase, TrmH family
MLRTADWFGIRHVVCSMDCVELYNPKTIQATMGSLFRVIVHYTDLIKLLENSKLPAYAAAMHGQSLIQSEQPKKGWLVIGSESHGISADILERCSHKIHIPGQGGAESLNAAVACGILLWEMCGRTQSS